VETVFTMAWNTHPTASKRSHGDLVIAMAIFLTVTQRGEPRDDVPREKLLNLVELRGDAGGAFAAGLCPGKKVVLAFKDDGSKRSFGGVIVCALSKVHESSG
jgi:hypothetical protein